MRRRHLRNVLRIEQRIYPRPWTYGLFLGEIGQRATRMYLVAKVGGEVVGYAGLFQAVDESHVTTIVVDPEWHRRGHRHPDAPDPGPVRDRPGEPEPDARGAGEERRRPGPVPAVRVRTGRHAQGVLPRQPRGRLVMWANDIDTPEYAARLAGIELHRRGRRSSRAAGSDLAGAGARAGGARPRRPLSSGGWPT